MNKQILFGLLILITGFILVGIGTVLKLNSFSSAGLFLMAGLVVGVICLVYFGVLIVIRLLKSN